MFTLRSTTHSSVALSPITGDQLLEYPILQQEMGSGVRSAGRQGACHSLCSPALKQSLPPGSASLSRLQLLLGEVILAAAPAMATFDSPDWELQRLPAVANL